MNRTDLVTEIMKLTGHKRSVHPDVTFGIHRILDRHGVNSKKMDYRDLRRQFEKETGNDFQDVNTLDGVTAVYIDWLEQRIEKLT